MNNVQQGWSTLDVLEFAERILLLLKPEVDGLGFNAKNVFPKLRFAIGQESRLCGYCNQLNGSGCRCTNCGGL